MDGNHIEIIEESFLKDLIKRDSVTDVSYNGQEIFYKDNLRGRLKSDIVVSPKEAYSFIRQIANVTDSLFSVTDPVLDVSIGKYRINATHQCISRKNREKVISFHIRIGYDKLRIKDNGEFIPQKALELLDFALSSKNSIVIGGKTGTGKTEFQKFLISRITPNTRIIILDNINELETDFFCRDLDSQTWLVLDDNKASFDDLIKNSLRSNPDWLIIGEVRSKEMLNLLNSAMTGHPTITTLHAKDLNAIYRRMARMAMIGNESLIYEETLTDVHDHFKLIVHLISYFDEKKKCYVRRVDTIGTNIDGTLYELYKYPNIYHKIPPELRNDLEISNKDFNEYNSDIKKGD
ncbi:MAG: type II/IV secretion system ATPase subunit [Bacilli bacterium]|nr:type II/IV secretion system ATPase subunit [Bacilli bacterium]